MVKRKTRRPPSPTLPPSPPLPAPSSEASEDTQTASASTSHAEPKHSPPPSDPNPEEGEDESETTGSKNILTTRKGKELSSVMPSPGKNMFQRVWTEEDELAVVKGLVNYTETYGKDPSNLAWLSAFHEEIKGDLHIEFSKDQLLNKIRSIKKKHITNLRRFRNGRTITLKWHDRVCFRLLRKIWDDDDVKKKKKKRMNDGTEAPMNLDGGCSGRVLSRYMDNVFEDVVSKNNFGAPMKVEMKNALLDLESEKWKDLEKKFTSFRTMELDFLKQCHELKNDFSGCFDES